MAFTITGNTIITGTWTANSSGPTPPTPPVSITAVAGATTIVNAIQNTAITSFNPFGSVTGGILPYTYYVSSGTLPTGVTINSSTGVVSGTPTVTYSSANVTFSVVDAYSTLATTSVTVNFTVNAPLSATAGATTTVTGEQTLAITGFNTFSSVSGGYTPYVYGTVSGTLPTGITLDTGNGYVSGTPSVALTGNVVFKVTDNQSTIASTTSTVSFNIATRISAVAGATTTVSQQQNTAIASFNPFGSVSGGYTPYTYYISSGTLPTGITLDTSTGLVSGTPTIVQAASNVVFRVKDSQNTVAATSVTVSFTVTTPPASPYTVNYLLVAGGGGGGKSAASGTAKGGGGGGGGGGFTTGSYPQNPGTVLSITVGSGGSAGSAGAGSNGTQSTLTGATTATGGGGGSGFTPAGVNASGGSPGGSGGGGANNGNCTPYGGYTPQGGGSGSQGHAGGSSGASPGGPPFPNQGYGGGGGGGGGAGSSGNNGTIGPDTPFNAAWTGVGGPGGTGSTWTYTGATLYAGGGGGGGGIYLTPAPSGPSSYGGGGAGGSSPGGTSQPGAAGTAGVVILAVPTPQYSGTKTGGVTSNPPAAPGQTVITWTSPGSYTV
jgi:hypothetical protein